MEQKGRARWLLTFQAAASQLTRSLPNSLIKRLPFTFSFFFSNFSSPTKSHQLPSSSSTRIRLPLLLSQPTLYIPHLLSLQSRSTCSPFLRIRTSLLSPYPLGDRDFPGFFGSDPAPTHHNHTRRNREGSSTPIYLYRERLRYCL